MQIINLLARGPLPYMEVDRLQRYIHNRVSNDELPDTLILWQSQDVYTAGRKTADADILDTAIPVIRMDRGGSVTYHGPGQLVIYPVVKVKPPQDVVSFVRNTELAIISALDKFGLTGHQVEGRSGVWILEPMLADRKICAIGIKFGALTTMHGLALNVNTDLDKFMRVVPCGIADAGVTSLAELGVAATMDEVAAELVTHLSAVYQQFLARPSADISSADATELLALAADAPPQLNDFTGSAWLPSSASS